jgi:hypothetical protein
MIGICQKKANHFWLPKKSLSFGKINCFLSTNNNLTHTLVFTGAIMLLEDSGVGVEL